ncbi:MAG: amino acid permease [Deltaproteobacteria bacterium]|nr:amino acid permease [Deltaproteobacteria bacterium]
MNTRHGKDVSGDKTGTMGTFAGVFTPSVLTILGIILFLRLGYVVGSAGLGRALIIITLANAISVLTSISISAIATNIKVKGGGDYYLISRTLGPEFGGAIGLVLFLAQSVSIAFYCIGFGEAMTVLLPQSIFTTPRIIAIFAVSLLFIFAWLGADWATRFQYVVMALLVAALFSFFAGGLVRWEMATLVQNWTAPSEGPKFWVIFAIFFPAVTGFTQGVSMSGDLKNPGESLPMGTFMAVGISILVYLGAAFVFAGVLSNEILMKDYGAMKRVARSSVLINAGVVAATLSSAMASFLGAPRILQSLAKDRIFPFLLPFAKGFGLTDNPRRGVLLSAAIAWVTISMGQLNLIARVVSMFFLISYGLLNYATYYEARAASPSFRPKFKWFDKRLSLLGFLACLLVMLAIDFKTGLIAVSILFAIYQYLKRTAGPARWADSRRSYYLKRARENLLEAYVEPEHDRDWRPQILAFSKDAQRRPGLLRFASWLEGRSGLTTVVKILEGEGVKMLRLQEESESELRSDIAAHGFSAFPLVVFAPDLDIALNTLIQSTGVGPLKANTILLNWLDPESEITNHQREIGFVRNLRAAYRLGRNIVVLDADEDKWNTLENIPGENRRIDVWWLNDATSRLMLLLGYLITRSDPWGAAKIRVLAAGYTADTSENLTDLKNNLEEARIEAEPIIVTNADIDKLSEYSADAAVVFLPFRLRGDQITCPIDAPIEEIVSRLPVTAFVLAAEDIALDAEPEQGTAGDMAVAMDALADAEKKAVEVEKEAAKTREIAETARGKLLELENNTGDTEEDLGTKLKTAADNAEKEADKAFRKAAKARAKVEEAAKIVKELDPTAESIEKKEQ